MKHKAVTWFPSTCEGSIFRMHKQTADWESAGAAPHQVLSAPSSTTSTKSTQEHWISQGLELCLNTGQDKTQKSPFMLDMVDTWLEHQTSGGLYDFQAWDKAWGIASNKHPEFPPFIQEMTKHYVKMKWHNQSYRMTWLYNSWVDPEHTKSPHPWKYLFIAVLFIIAKKEKLLDAHQQMNG